jgi:hypothetical protein
VYRLAAQELDKSQDEVFEYAKELQESMHLAHEKGRLEDCEWTYWVWQEAVDDLKTNPL